MNDSLENSRALCAGVIVTGSAAPLANDFLGFLFDNTRFLARELALGAFSVLSKSTTPDEVEQELKSAIWRDSATVTVVDTSVITSVVEVDSSALLESIAWTSQGSLPCCQPLLNRVTLSDIHRLC